MAVTKVEKPRVTYPPEGEDFDRAERLSMAEQKQKMLEDTVRVHESIVGGLVRDSRKAFEKADARFFVLKGVDEFTYIVDSGESVETRGEDFERKDPRVMVLDEYMNVYGIGIPLWLTDLEEGPQMGFLDTPGRDRLEKEGHPTPLPSKERASGDESPVGRHFAVLVRRGDLSGKKGDDVYRIPATSLNVVHISEPIEEAFWFSRKKLGSRFASVRDEVHEAEGLLAAVMDGEITKVFPESSLKPLEKKAPQRTHEPKEHEETIRSVLDQFTAKAREIRTKRDAA